MVKILHFGNKDQSKMLAMKKHVISDVQTIIVMATPYLVKVVHAAVLIVAIIV